VLLDVALGRRDRGLSKRWRPARSASASSGSPSRRGTDDLRESPLVALAEHLIGKGRQLRVYDPAVQLSRLLGANRRFIDERLPHLASLLHDSLAAVIGDSEVVAGRKRCGGPRGAARTSRITTR